MLPKFLQQILRPLSSASIGITPVAAIAAPDGSQKATIAAGCFWGVEHMFRHEYMGNGLYDTRVGYVGGYTQNPSYKAVCTGRTGRKFFSLYTCPASTFLNFYLFGGLRRRGELNKTEIYYTIRTDCISVQIIRYRSPSNHL